RMYGETGSRPCPRMMRVSYMISMRDTTLSFFFSSRRRHTSSDRDWSSDVCSSDLMHADRIILHDLVEARGHGFVDDGVTNPSCAHDPSQEAALLAAHEDRT